jgi:hypothetical protein
MYMTIVAQHEFVKFLQRSGISTDNGNSTFRLPFGRVGVTLHTIPHYRTCVGSAPKKYPCVCCFLIIGNFLELLHPSKTKVTECQKFHFGIHILGPQSLVLVQCDIKPWLHVPIKMYHSCPSDCFRADAWIVA